MSRLPRFHSAVIRRYAVPAVLVAFVAVVSHAAQPKESGAGFFNLRDVTLAPGPFARAMAKNAEYLLSLEPDRFLAGYRANAGLEPKAPKYGGWESLGLAGHTLGHYLTALAWMVEATGDARFRERLNYTIAELAACQTEARGGLISAIPDDEKIFAAVAAGDIRAQRFNLNGGWVPWYNLHKMFAGLHDAHVHGGNDQALEVLRRLADWADRITAGLSDEQFQRMLYAEHGGMNEALADLHALTGEARYLRLAERFCDREILDPLARGEDRLDGYHANTQIPKVIGAARLHEVTGDAALGRAAHSFWETVVRNRSWVIGGNSEAEHFFPPGQNGQRLTHSTAETCNSYNMLRLTELLYKENPAAGWFDYYERTLYNHILASIDPESGRCTYFMSLRPGFFKYYGDPENAFWCCTGTGMENHTKYTRGIYTHAPDEQTLFVNLFIPSTLDWKARKVRLEQHTRFPEEAGTSLVVRAEQPARFTLKLRPPAWAAAAPAVRINGKDQPVTRGADGYLAINREWHDGDKVGLTLPMELRTEPLAHAPDTFAVLYGPLVLAGQLGTSGLEGIDLDPPGENQHRGYVPPVAPVMVAEEEHILAGIEPVPGQKLTWRTRDLVRPEDATLIPFYRLHHERHIVYWSRYTPEQWPSESKRRTESAARETALAARTVDDVICGEQQPEVNHAFRGELTNMSLHFGRAARGAQPGGWFEYRLACDPDAPLEFLCRWWGGDAGRLAELLIDGEPFATQRIDRDAPDAEVVTTHPVPPALTRGKSEIVLRIRAGSEARTPQLLALRLVRTTDSP